MEKQWACNISPCIISCLFAVTKQLNSHLSRILVTQFINGTVPGLCGLHAHPTNTHKIHVEQTNRGNKTDHSRDKAQSTKLSSKLLNPSQTVHQQYSNRTMWVSCTYAYIYVPPDTHKTNTHTHTHIQSISTSENMDA